jgi:hypothetical protein
MYKIIVAGGREFNDFELLRREFIAFCLERKYGSHDIEIVSGTAKGADKLGERLAELYEIPVNRMPADWDTHGKSAGYRRNADMAAYADACIVFWDGESKGTKHMIDLAKKAGLELHVVYYEKPASMSKALTQAHKGL